MKLVRSTPHIQLEQKKVQQACRSGHLDGMDGMDASVYGIRGHCT